MTNIEAIDSIEQWLLDAGRISGYTVRAVFSAQDLVDNLPLCLIRKSGNGELNSNLREMDYMIQLFDEAQNIVAMSNELSAIQSLAESTVYPAGVSKCRLIVSQTDAQETEGGLFTAMLQIRLTVEL